jgi:hypothetical protein
MAKFNLKDLKKAIDFLEKQRTNENISVAISPTDVLTFTFHDDLSQDHVCISVYDSETNLFPKITRTERL